MKKPETVWIEDYFPRWDGDGKDYYKEKEADAYMAWQQDIIERKQKQIDKLRHELKTHRGVAYRMNSLLDQELA